MNSKYLAMVAIYLVFSDSRRPCSQFNRLLKLISVAENFFSYRSLKKPSIFTHISMK